MEKYKLSIITITYNCKVLLKNTIESLICQSYKQFEHIVIDGGSSDGTVDVIKENEDHILYWTSEKDKGIYDAMNKGLCAASGEYILFLNAGDLLFDKETLANIPFDSNLNADIFYGETMIIDKDGTCLGLRRKKLPYDLGWKHFKNGMVVCHQSILVKRKLAPEYNINYSLSADVDWVTKCLKKSNKTVFTGTIISKYLEGGASLDNHSRSLKERFKVMKVHFGLLVTVLYHIKFGFENLAISLKLIPRYRKIIQ